MARLGKFTAYQFVVRHKKPIVWVTDKSIEKCNVKRQWNVTLSWRVGTLNLPCVQFDEKVKEVSYQNWFEVSRRGRCSLRILFLASRNSKEVYTFLLTSLDSPNKDVLHWRHEYQCSRNWNVSSGNLCDVSQREHWLCNCLVDMQKKYQLSFDDICISSHWGIYQKSENVVYWNITTKNNFSNLNKLLLVQFWRQIGIIKANEASIVWRKIL